MPSAAVRKRAERNASLLTGNRMRPSLSISSSVRMNMADLPSHGRPMLGERRCARKVQRLRPEPHELAWRGPDLGFDAINLLVKPIEAFMAVAECLSDGAVVLPESLRKFP